MKPRERLLHKAHELFYRDGIRATGIDRIIAEAEVTKVTFYRHFPSKNALVAAYLDYRHERWMAWFDAALGRHRATGLDAGAAIVATLGEWFADGSYRGCAFINATVEFDGTIPEVAEICRNHKRQLVERLEAFVEGTPLAGRAALLAMLIDGAIITAQSSGDGERTVAVLAAGLAALTADAA